jgi:toxin CcdB
MTQFTVYENNNNATKKTYPHLLDIQSNLLNELRTTVVIPIYPTSLVSGAAMSGLCPVLTIDRKEYVALTQQIAGIARKSLGKVVCDLYQFRSEIIAALDFIISGI